METTFLIFGCVGFGAGCLLLILASCIPYRLVDEINERSPADQQVDTFHITATILRRHQQLCPDSSNRRLMNATMIAGVLMMCAGASLLLDYGSLHDLNRNEVVAPRQQSIAGTLTAGPASRNSYGYTFNVRDHSYSGWGLLYGPERKTGQEVVIYYDPNDPTVSGLSPFEYSSGQRAWDVGIGLAIVLLVAAGSVSSTLACWRYWIKSDLTKPATP